MELGSGPGGWGHSQEDHLACEIQGLYGPSIGRGAAVLDRERQDRSSGGPQSDGAAPATSTYEHEAPQAREPASSRRMTNRDYPTVRADPRRALRGEVIEMQDRPARR